MLRVDLNSWLGHDYILSHRAIVIVASFRLAGGAVDAIDEQACDLAGGRGDKGDPPDPPLSRLITLPPFARERDGTWYSPRKIRNGATYCRGDLFAGGGHDPSNAKTCSMRAERSVMTPPARVESISAS